MPKFRYWVCNTQAKLVQNPFINSCNVFAFVVYIIMKAKPSSRLLGTFGKGGSETILFYVYLRTPPSSFGKE